MKKVLIALLCALLLVPMLATGVSAAAARTHTVASGDTLWKIANRYQVGLSEIKAQTPISKTTI